MVIARMPEDRLKTFENLQQQLKQPFKSIVPLCVYAVWLMFSDNVTLCGSYFVENKDKRSVGNPTAIAS
eukprot:15792663-Heterocapsa_arctica.AAC.1